MRQPEVTTMEEFFPEIDIDANQAEAIARGLYAVARVDGVHERELALIGEVYQAALAGDGSATTAPMASLERAGALAPRELAALLAAGPVRELFVKTAFLLAWADGNVSAAERATIGQFAQALELPADAQTRLEAEVKDYLLRPFAGLANVEAAAAVAKKLGA
jgi:tellurite resistance protein